MDEQKGQPGVTVWGGPAALICAGLGWLATVLSCPHGSATFLLGVACALAAVIVGAVSGSKMGYLALFLGTVQLLVMLSCVCLFSNGFISPFWVD